MAKFKYDFSIDAPSEQDADSKLTSLSILAAKLSTKELEKLAHIVKHDPIKTALAKKALGV